MSTPYDAITARLHDGDPARGAATFERLIRLAGITDRQQQFMFQRVDVQPQDARDIVAYLASQGIVVAAVALDGEDGAGRGGRVKRKVLDLYCGGGGAGKGYADAGFDVTATGGSASCASGARRAGARF